MLLFKFNPLNSIFYPFWTQKFQLFLQKSCSTICFPASEQKIVEVCLDLVQSRTETENCKSISQSDLGLKQSLKKAGPNPY
jgi:hypothetical protein